ncbi:MAG: hypothetical protein Q7L55_05775 [Actinomycetota bacterium]|nr:hypothetical protein [Actinomycetota bacterium]
MTSQMTGQFIPDALPLSQFGSEFSGIEREVEIGLRLAPTHQAARLAARGLAVILEHFPSVPTRLIGVDAEDTRLHLTLAVSLGSLVDVKLASPRSCLAVLLVRRVIEDLAAYDPCLVEIPDPAAPMAMLARGLQVSTALADSSLPPVAKLEQMA